MKHNHTDEEIQAAVDGACKEIHAKHRLDIGSNLVLDTNAMPGAWESEKHPRLHLLKSALDKLPEPPPPTADGKTPGEVYQDAFHMQNPEAFTTWRGTNSHRQGQIEQASQAVLTAFGHGSAKELLQARLCAESFRECAEIKFGPMPFPRKFPWEAAAREDQPASQPAEIPWIAWHGGETSPLRDEEVEEWELKYRLGSTAAFKFPPTMAFGWKHHNHQDDIIAYRVTKWHEGYGPAAVAWKAKCEFWNQRCLEKEKDILLQQDRTEKAEAELARKNEMWENQMIVIRRLQLQVEELEAKSQLSTLRPITEAGEVPAGAVRVTGYWNVDRWILGNISYSSDTHFADILLPEVFR